MRVLAAHPLEAQASRSKLPKPPGLCSPPLAHQLHQLRPRPLHSHCAAPPGELGDPAATREPTSHHHSAALFDARPALPLPRTPSSSCLRRPPGLSDNAIIAAAKRQVWRQWRGSDPQPSLAQPSVAYYYLASSGFSGASRGSHHHHHSHTSRSSSRAAEKIVAAASRQHSAQQPTRGAVASLPCLPTGCVVRACVHTYAPRLRRRSPCRLLCHG